MSAIEKAVALLRHEAESMKECHTVGVGGAWYGDSAKAEYEEMIAAADAAIAERDELLESLQAIEMLYAPLARDSTAATWIDKARAAITRATGEEK